MRPLAGRRDHEQQWEQKHSALAWRLLVNYREAITVEKPAVPPSGEFKVLLRVLAQPGFMFIVRDLGTIRRPS